MRLSVRTRFEVFKRDDFTCQYCGRKSPAVVLEVDHIVPRREGGADDVVNLRTSCWECNHGKADKPLNEIVTGEDPHDRAVLLLERERQLREYNAVVARDRARRETEGRDLVRYWNTERKLDTGAAMDSIAEDDWRWLFGALQWCPMEVIRNFMDAAIKRYKSRNLKYVAGCCRNWLKDQGADHDTQDDEPDEGP